MRVIADPIAAANGVSGVEHLVRTSMRQLALSRNQPEDENIVSDGKSVCRVKAGNRVAVNARVGEGGLVAGDVREVRLTNLYMSWFDPGSRVSMAPMSERGEDLPSERGSSAANV